LFPWIFIAFLDVSQQGMFKNTTNKIAGHFPQPKKSSDLLTSLCFFFRGELWACRITSYGSILLGRMIHARQVLRTACASYDHALTKTPIRTKLATGLCLSFAGDRSAQWISPQKTTPIPHASKETETLQWDNERTVRQASWSAVCLPIVHFWYQYLQTVSSKPMRVLLDQFVFSPPIVAAYFAYLGTAQGKSIVDVTQDVNQKLWSTMCVNWVVWIPVQAINQTVVPLPYRVLVANFTGFFYGIFLSYAANNESFGT
jgi:protein Mpv17